MNFRQFAVNNVIRSKRTYIAHFMSSAFSVMIFFIYALLSYHPSLSEGIVSSSGTLSMLGTMGMTVSQYIVFVFSFFFLLYSVGAFIKVRQKEFGILLIHGMSRRQLNRMLFMENLVIGAAAIITGIGTGLLFSKLILLICARLLAIEEGLPFYLPLKAIGVTAAAYCVLFVLVALFSSVMLRRGTLLALVKADETPKPAPKASPWLAVLAVLLLITGYGMVMVFAVLQIFSLVLLFGGVGLVIAGTYLLFTQSSVYFLRSLQKKPKLFFRKTNLLTISELMYRLKDNAIMFFIVSVISASAFTGIGTTLALGDPGLSAMENPYAYTLRTYDDSELSSGEQVKQMIRKKLDQAGFAYKEAQVAPFYTDNGYNLIKLSEYNTLLRALGRPEAALNMGEALLTPGSVTQKNKYRIDGYEEKTRVLEVDRMQTEVRIVKAETFIALPVMYNGGVVVPDQSYEKLMEAQAGKFIPTIFHVFYMENWKDTWEVSRDIVDTANNENSFQVEALYFQWKNAQQENGILLIISGLIGIVFFTFAASFIYFRLYADLSRDEEQYRMIAKVGLSRNELKKMVSRQLVVIFFLPMVIAVIHSGVAFIALQQLVDFSIVSHSVQIFIFFLSVQVIYFFVTRWRYLNRLYQTIK